MDTIEKRIEMLESNEEFMNELKNTPDYDALSKLLEKYEINVNADDLKNVMKMNEVSEEISDDALECVTGGAVMPTAVAVVSKLVQIIAKNPKAFILPISPKIVKF